MELLLHKHLKLRSNEIKWYMEKDVAIDESDGDDMW